MYYRSEVAKLFLYSHKPLSLPRKINEENTQDDHKSFPKKKILFINFYNNLIFVTLNLNEYCLTLIPRIYRNKKMCKIQSQHPTNVFRHFFFIKFCFLCAHNAFFN